MKNNKKIMLSQTITGLTVNNFRFPFNYSYNKHNLKLSNILSYIFLLKILKNQKKEYKLTLLNKKNTYYSKFSQRQNYLKYILDVSRAESLSRGLLSTRSELKIAKRPKGTKNVFKSFSSFLKTPSRSGFIKEPQHKHHSAAPTRSGLKLPYYLRSNLKGYFNTGGNTQFKQYFTRSETTKTTGTNYLSGTAPSERKETRKLEIKTPQNFLYNSLLMNLKNESSTSEKEPRSIPSGRSSGINNEWSNLFISNQQLKYLYSTNSSFEQIFKICTKRANTLHAHEGDTLQTDTNNKNLTKTYSIRKNLSNKLLWKLQPDPLRARFASRNVQERISQKIHAERGQTQSKYIQNPASYTGEQTLSTRLAAPHTGGLRDSVTAERLKGAHVSRETKDVRVKQRNVLTSRGPEEAHETTQIYREAYKKTRLYNKLTNKQLKYYNSIAKKNMLHFHNTSTNIFSVLETRLDVLLYRLKWAQSLHHAQYLIKTGKILLINSFNKTITHYTKPTSVKTLIKPGTILHYAMHRGGTVSRLQTGHTQLRFADPSRPVEHTMRKNTHPLGAVFNLDSLKKLSQEASNILIKKDIFNCRNIIKPFLHNYSLNALTDTLCVHASKGKRPPQQARLVGANPRRGSFWQNKISTFLKEPKLEEIQIPIYLSIKNLRKNKIIV